MVWLVVGSTFGAPVYRRIAMFIPLSKLTFAGILGNARIPDVITYVFDAVTVV